MRCFVSVDLDPDLMQRVEDLQKELVGLDTKLINPENLHFTLKFLGEVDEETVNKIRILLRKLASEEDQFKIEICGAGVFPNEKLIRVVWIGAPRLTNLQMAVNQTLAELFRKENPSPHLTIARVRSQTYRDEIIRFVKTHESIEIGRMNVEEIKLKKSTITNKGPVYEDIEIFELGK